MEIEKINVRLPEISDIDIGYAAGFYDGDGSITSTNETSCCVSITQKDIWPLTKMQNIFGGNISFYNGYHYWRIYGDECKAFIVLIFNHVSPRRQEQIEKYESFFFSVESCPNGHPYVDGSYKISEDPRGRIYRTCLECLAANTKRKNSPTNRAAIMLANLHGITKEEALNLLNSGKKQPNNEDPEETEETIQ